MRSRILLEEEEEKDGSEEWVEYEEEEILLGEEDELCLQPFWFKRMLSKRQRPYDESELPAACGLRANIRDIFASNTLPASRVQSLLMCSNVLATIPRLVVAGVATRLLLRFST